MKNSNNICTVNKVFSHQLPPPWKKGDLGEFEDSATVNLLLEYLLANNLNARQLQLLREKEIFRDLYYKFHQELEERTGVIFLKNTIFSHLDIEQRKNLFFKFSQFVGMPVPINKAGELLRKVKNIGLRDSVDKPVRGHLTNQALPFHSDRADITMLLCESEATSGGEFKICSSASIFLALKKYPVLLNILAKNIPHDLRDEGSDQTIICYHPIVSYQDTFVVRYIRRFINSVSRHGIILEDKLLTALNKLDEILSEVDFAHEIMLQPGDLIFFNNHITLHSRNAFLDDEINQRCLLRVWLSSEFTRALPKSFEPIFHAIDAGCFRGGVIQE